MVSKSVYVWKNILLSKYLVFSLCLTFSKIYLTIEYEKSFNILTVVFFKALNCGVSSKLQISKGWWCSFSWNVAIPFKILSSSFCLRGCKANKTPKSFLSSARLWWFFSNKRWTFAFQNLNLACNAKSWKILEDLTNLNFLQSKYRAIM